MHGDWYDMLHFWSSAVSLCCAIVACTVCLHRVHIVDPHLLLWCCSIPSARQHSACAGYAWKSAAGITHHCSNALPACRIHPDPHLLLSHLLMPSAHQCSAWTINAWWSAASMPHHNHCVLELQMAAWAAMLDSVLWSYKSSLNSCNSNWFHPSWEKVDDSTSVCKAWL